MDLTITHRGKQLNLPSLPPETSLSTLRHKIADHLHTPVSTIRLVTSGKLLSPSSDTNPLQTLIPPTATILVLAPTHASIHAIQNAKEDKLLRPFSAPSPKYVGRPRNTTPIPSAHEYGFGSVEAIAGLPGQKRAEEILNGLACDRGFLKAMGMKKWRVGKLKEMLPDGKVGVDAVCVLGYNVNRGAEIHLRIRTDDMQGFRGMHLIRRVLAHELAHNEVSEHDNRFKEVMRWVERVAERENWRRGGESVGGVEIREDSCGAAGRECGGEVKSGGRVGGVRDVSRLLDARVREMRVDAEGCHAPDMRDGDKPPREDEAGYASRHARAPMQTGGMSAAVKAALREDSGATTQTAHASPAPSARASACAQLASLGFHPTLCRIALRECNQSMSKASDWLLSAPPAHDAAEKTGVFARTESCVRSVQTSVPGEHMVRCLEMLHAYMGNVVREPRRGGRYTRINAENEMFKNRVGMYEGAMKVMREVGWKDGEAGLVWEGELEQVYVAKCVLEEMLRALLG